MSDYTPEQQQALDSSEEIFRRTREAPLAAREIIARKQAEVDAAYAREFPSYEKLRIERDALRAELRDKHDSLSATKLVLADVERSYEAQLQEQRARITALEYNLGISTERARNYEMIAERNRDRVAALKAKADLACASLVSAEKEIVSLKQCHHCENGDHSEHAVISGRCTNSIERRCACIDALTAAIKEAKHG